MEIAGAAVGECTKSAIVHVEREFGYLIHFRKNTNMLSDNIQQLTATKSDVKAMIDAAVRNGEVVSETVNEWMKRADRVLVQVTKVSEEASVINSWFKGWCCGRFSLGRKSEKKILVIQKLSVEGSGFSDGNVSYRMPTQSLRLTGTDDFNAFASRDSTVEEIRKALLDYGTNLVGVYGMPGVGKTALIKAIAKQVKEEQLFQEVVVITVSQKPSLINLQDTIAERLDFGNLGVDLSVRADRLSERLNQDDKKTLVILDDVWERIELLDVGIPRGKCCKVVFTTRFQAVCDSMEANVKMEVVVLSENDSWILFQKRSGKVKDSPLAREVLKECGGLPLAIVTLGRALRDTDAIVWGDTLKQLRRSIFEGMSSVFSSIKLSYNFLESESVKICFLFCSLFPEDHVITMDALLIYVMGEKLLEDVDNYDEARGRIHGISDKLISSGLLLRYYEGDIMMHDVVRDVAISIAEKEKGHIVKAGRNLSYWPNEMELGNCKRLSMMYNPIQYFPTIPIKAPNLQALFLNNNSKLTELPSDFFVGMKSLVTLDLSYTHLTSLPPSLSCLQNLRTLLLNRSTISSLRIFKSNLLSLSHIEKLERLEVLSLRFCKFIDDLSEVIGNLINLRILDLTRAVPSNPMRFIPNPFLKVSRLEEFHLLYSNIFEIDNEMGWLPSNRVPGNIFSEIGSLSRLTSLELNVYDGELCYQDIPGPWQNLTRFQIDINVSMPFMFGYRYLYSRTLMMTCNMVGVKKVGDWVLVLLGRTYCLWLTECNDLESLTEYGSAVVKGMNENLKRLYLEKCKKMESLVNSNSGLFQSSHHNAFLSNLEHLEISSMPELVEIYKGTLMVEKKEEEEIALSNSNTSRITISDPLNLSIFPNLKKLEIINVSKIRYVFTMRVARNLLLLEILLIRSCPEMEVVLKYEDGENILFNQDAAVLPRLKDLKISSAPKLKSFTNRSNLVMELPSLEKLKLNECYGLERLPFGTTSVPNLNTFHMDQDLYNRLEWEDESVKERMRGNSLRCTVSP